MVVLVEPALSAKNVAEAPVFVSPTVLEETVVMTVAEVTPVESVLHLKPAQMVSVLELLPLIVLEDLVDLTVLEEAVVHANQVKDVVEANVNATMIAMKETVVTQSNLRELTLVCAHQDLADPAPQDSLVDQMVDAQLKLHVTF